MHKLSMASLFCLISSIAHAQQQDLPSVFNLTKPVICTATATLFRRLDQEYQEHQLWIGKDTNTGSYISLWINNIVGSWTLIQYDGVTGCVLGTGTQASAI
jgi:hypothetical protein